MKHIKIIFLSISCLLQTYIVLAQTPLGPPIYWTHGLGGNMAKWNAYAPFFEDKLNSLDATNSIRTSYDSGNGLVNGANEIAPAMDPMKPEAIAIGHSMGGLVTREIARMPSRPGSPASNQRFKAFVTIASSHSGAQIGNSIDNGDVRKLVFWGTTRLAAGPASTVLAFFRFPTTPTVITAWGTAIVANVINSIAEVETTVVGAPKIKVGHSEMIQLNSAPPPNMPKVALQAEEQEPILWRVVSHVTDDPGANYKVDEYGDKDDKWPDNIDAAKNIYWGCTTTAAVAGVVFAFFNPPVAVNCFIVSAAWLWGATWFDHANDEWHWIVGAARTGSWSYSTGNIKHICADEPDVQVKAQCYSDCANNNDEGCWIEEIITGYGTIHEASDGIVPLSVQKDLPDKLPWTVTAGLANGDKTGCGHQEARNHPGIKQALIDVFDGKPNIAFKRQ
jgi:pimeloyl-ACP methyl ester carboxylesterase